MLNVRLLGPTSLGRPVERGLRKRGGAAPQTYYYNYVCMPLFRRLQKCVPPDHSKMHGQLRDCLSACFLSRPFTHANYKTRQKQEQAHKHKHTHTHTRTRTQPRAKQTQAPTQKANSNDTRPQAHQPQNNKNKKKTRRGTGPQHQGNTTRAKTSNTTAQQTRPHPTTTLQLRDDCVRITILLTPDLS